MLEFSAILPVDGLAIINKLAADIEQKLSILNAAGEIPAPFTCRIAYNHVLRLVVAFDDPIRVESLEPVGAVFDVFEAVLEVDGGDALFREGEVIRAIEHASFRGVLAHNFALLSSSSSLNVIVQFRKTAARVRHIVRFAPGIHYINVHTRDRLDERIDRMSDVVERAKKDLFFAGGQKNERRSFSFLLRKC